MEKIIKKAIEGGYTVRGMPLRWEEKTKSWWYYWMGEDEEGNPIELENPACLTNPIGMYPMILDPLFWQALGKACGWAERKYVSEKKDLLGWQAEGLRFHEINLTEGWSPAVEYLEELLQAKE